MGTLLFYFLLVLKTVDISAQEISSEDVNTMLDRLIKQTTQNNDTSISIEMNRETYIKKEIEESGNDSDIYYLNTLSPRPDNKTSDEIFNDEIQLKEKSKNLKNQTTHEAIYEAKIIPGIPEKGPIVKENKPKEELESDQHILKSLFDEPDDKEVNLEGDRSGLELQDTTRKNIRDFGSLENKIDLPVRELDLFQEYPETINRPKSNNKEDSNQIFDQIIKGLKDTIAIDNLIEAATMRQKPTTAAKFLNELSNRQQTENNPPEPIRAVLNTYDRNNAVFAEMLDEMFRSKPKNDFIVNEVLSNFDDSASRSSNSLMENVIQQRVNAIGPSYVMPYRHASIVPTLSPRFSIPNYQPNFRRSIVNRPVSYANQPVVYHAWRPINLPVSPLKFSLGEKSKHTYFTTSLIDKLTTRPAMKPLSYNIGYK